MDIFGSSKKDKDETEFAEDASLKLRREELDIDKDRVQTGEVMLGKDIIEEKKTVDVPVTHEEVVIERRAIDPEPSDSPIMGEDVIHIPVSEERVNVDKHTVITGEVSAYKREVEENHKVEETLKREEARVDSDGDPNIVSDGSLDDFDQ